MDALKSLLFLRNVVGQLLPPLPPARLMVVPLSNRCEHACLVWVGFGLEGAKEKGAVQDENV